MTQEIKIIKSRKAKVDLTKRCICNIIKLLKKPIEIRH